MPVLALVISASQVIGDSRRTEGLVARTHCITLQFYISARSPFSHPFVVIDRE